MEKIHENKIRIGNSSRWRISIDNMQVGRAEEGLQGCWINGVFFFYADANGELNNEGKNICLLNGEFLTYCIIYCETNEHTKTMKERTIMIEQDYKSALRWVNVIVHEAKVATLEVSTKKKQIRDGKKKIVDDVRVETFKKKQEWIKTLT